MIAELYAEARAGGRVSGADAEMAWKEFKEGIVGKVRRTYRTQGEAKRMRWWNEKVKCAVKKKKVLYRWLLDTATEKAKRLYNEAKMVRKAINGGVGAVGEGIGEGCTG